VPRSDLHFFPLAAPFLLGLALLAAVAIVAVELGVISYAYERIGIAPEHAAVILALSLLGSYVNFAVGELPEERHAATREVSIFGVRHVVPVIERSPGTIIAVNLGGAIVPTLVSLHLIAKNGIYLQALLGVAAVAAIVHRVARPIAGVGIAVPAVLPPLAAAMVALLLSPHAAPPLAYVAGTLGTLVGADLANLGKVRGLGAPVASIGGAGTFDGIFLTGILAVLLA
jgi:uncharacterized membrane protein